MKYPTKKGPLYKSKPYYELMTDRVPLALSGIPAVLSSVVRPNFYTTFEGLEPMEYRRKTKKIPKGFG